MNRLGKHASNFLSDPSSQSQAYHYFEELKQDPQGWSQCLTDIVEGNFRNVQEHFFLLQVVEQFIVKNYKGNMDINITSHVRHLMSNWMTVIANSTASQPFVIAKKMAHIFSLVFAEDFPDRWPRFMQEVFLEQLDNNKAQFFLRTLIEIDKEVVDREISRSQSLLDRNTRIKDAMRELCIQDVAQAWHEILQVCDDVTKGLCLQAISKYIDWIDLELVANDAMITLIIDNLDKSATMEDALDAVAGILYKGMDVEKKMALVSAFEHMFAQKHLLDVSEDYEKTRRTANLISNLGSCMIECFNKIPKENEKLLSACYQNIEHLIPKAMECFCHEDQECGETVVDFLKDYVDLLKASNNNDVLNLKREFLDALIVACIRHWSFPEDLEVGGTGECEDKFTDFRKDLRGIMYSIGAIDPSPIITKIHAIASQVCSNCESASVRQLETTVSLVFHLTDFLSVSYLRADNPTITFMVLMVLKSSIAARRIATINVQFFEIGSRYDKIVGNDVEALSNLVHCYLDDRGICHADEKVRARVVYLFCRFVKTHKAFLGPHVGNIIHRLIPLLGVDPNHSAMLSSDEQAFIFECTATLIVNGALTPAEKEQYMKDLASTLVSKFSATVSEIEATPAANQEKRELLIGQLQNTISYSSRITKAFSAQNSMDSCNCTEAFVFLMTTYLNALTVDNAEILLDTLRQYLHRMVICLDDQLIPVLPELFHKFVMVARTVKAMSDFLILAQQIFTKYKQKIIGVGINMTTLLQLILALLETRTDPNDEVETRSLCYFKRNYLQFCQSIISNKVLELVSNGGVELLQMFVSSVYQGTVDPDPVQQKVALAILNKLFVTYGQNEVIINSVWFKAMEAALKLPLCATYVASDPQCVLVEHEAIALLQTIRNMIPDRFDSCLSTFIPEDYVQRVSHSLSTLKGKELDRSMDDLFSKIRGQRGF
ncbi:hypothetical protein L596_004628 [Steinernema carpocapsae]|uniref:Exportin-T n=1 Tax=Steinernema carpocapsae TaxID=34508 RepID=A0A4U8UWJ4_STECR|nr:hypothetical protein L596_004628 [Steinernema carpocapsae]